MCVCVCQISVSLYSISQAIKNTDAKINDLSKEVTRLSSLLRSVETTIKQCRGASSTLAHLDEGIWEQIDIAVAGCGVAVGELDALVAKVGRYFDQGTATAQGSENKALRGKLNRILLYPAYSATTDELSYVTQNIYKSNCAMQTALAVLNV